MYSEGSKASKKLKCLLQDYQCGWMISSLMSFEQHFNYLWSYILTFQYYGLFVEFTWFPSFRLNPKITENLYLCFYKAQMNVDPFFYLYFNFLSTKTKVYKNEFNLINLDGLEALKRQIIVTWLEIWLNQIDMYVIWRTSQLLLKIHSHFSIMESL